MRIVRLQVKALDPCREFDNDHVVLVTEYVRIILPFLQKLNFEANSGDTADEIQFVA